ncbi:MAG: hypothetical protein ACI835_003233 [Planctomycetota bacterium]|jgi:hypothetical protein
MFTTLTLRPFLLHALSTSLLCTLASAQWSSDAANNLSVADGAGDQVQSKIAATQDGGCYISWLDGIGSGFDVRVQRLDAAGNEQWTHNGVLVADRGFSSTQDYGLDVDASGAAILAFRDDSSGSVEISAQRVTASGALPWGASGVALTSASSSTLVAPKITGTADGDIVVAWGDLGASSRMRVMRLTVAGGNAWVSPVDYVAPTGFYHISDMHDSGTDVILSIVHQTIPQIFGDYHLYADKLDATGATLWSATPTLVYGAGSLQIGNRPSFITDGSGGAVFSWYDRGQLQCHAQHLLSNGTAAFPAGGVLGSTNAAGARVAPSAAYDAATSSTYMFWTEMDGAQNQRGVSGQKFDASGSRQWGSSGLAIVPIGAIDVSFVQTVTTQTGAAVAWLESASFGNDRSRAAIVAAGGSVNTGPLDLASTSSGKSRLAAAKSLTTGDAIFAWTDDRLDAGDVLAQNLRADGGLGNGTPFVTFCPGSGCPCANDDAAGGCANSSGSGASLSGAGSASAAGDDFLAQLTSATAGQPVLLFYGSVALNSGSGLTFGDGLRCVGGSVVRVSIQAIDGSGSASWGPGLGSTFGWVSGDTILLQAWYRDPVGGPCGSGFNLTQGLELNVTP